MGARHRTKRNQVWIIQRSRQHWKQDTERRAIKYGQSRDVDNIESNTQNEGAIKYGQSREVDYIRSKTQKNEEQSSMDNPET